MVTRFRIGLYFLRSILSGVFFLFLVVMCLDMPGRPLYFCSVHSRITSTLLPFFAIFQMRLVINTAIWVRLLL